MAAVTLPRKPMFRDLRQIAGRFLQLILYLGLAAAGIVLLAWGFVFALAVAGGLLLLFVLMRLFGIHWRPRPGSRPAAGTQRAHPSQDGHQPGVHPQDAGQPGARQQDPRQQEKVIELQRRDDGSYE